MTIVARNELCVTNGSIVTLPSGRLAVDTPSSRAIVSARTPQRAELRFRFLGPSAIRKPLASGELRQQVGLRLRTQDNCNVLFAMWRIAPDSGMYVEIKSNPGRHRYDDCGTQGYNELAPEKSSPVADKMVWEGSVGAAVLEFDGPVGLRTDNARIEFDFLAPVETGAISTAQGHCKAFIGR
jgi:hypothetical protein